MISNRSETQAAVHAPRRSIFGIPAWQTSVMEGTISIDLPEPCVVAVALVLHVDAVRFNSEPLACGAAVGLDSFFVTIRGMNWKSWEKMVLYCIVQGFGFGIKGLGRFLNLEPSLNFFSHFAFLSDSSDFFSDLCEKCGFLENCPELTRRMDAFQIPANGTN